MTTKQPQAGEWWQQIDGTKYLCIAKNKHDETIWQVKDGGFRSLVGDYYWKHWRHLPDCDSFEWQPAADLPPQPQPKRVPVRLYWYDGNIVGRYDHSQPTDPSFQEIKYDGYKFYVEVQP